MPGVLGDVQQVVCQLGVGAGAGDADGCKQHVWFCVRRQTGAQLIGQAGVVEAVQKAVVECDGVVFLH
ncbi:hypothetical protein [Streptomyces sp. NPDC004230]